MKDNKRCPHCGVERFEQNEVCHYCGYNFKNNTIDNNYTESSIYSTENIDKNIDTNKKKKSKEMGCFGHIMFFIFVGPMLLIGFIFLGVGIGFTIYQQNIIKDFSTIEGTLYDYYDCEIEIDEIDEINDSEICSAKYVYYIDDKEYFASPNYTGEKDDFNHFETIHYNHNNPNENIIITDLSFFTLIGSILVILGLSIYIIVRIFVRKIKKTT